MDSKTIYSTLQNMYEIKEKLTEIIQNSLSHSEILPITIKSFENAGEGLLRVVYSVSFSIDYTTIISIRQLED